MVTGYHQQQPYRLVGHPVGHPGEFPLPSRLGKSKEEFKSRLIAVMTDFERSATNAEPVKYKEGHAFRCKLRETRVDLPLSPELFERSMDTNPNAPLFKTTNWIDRKESSTVKKEKNDLLFTKDEIESMCKQWKMSILAQPAELEEPFFKLCKNDLKTDYEAIEKKFKVSPEFVSPFKLEVSKKNSRNDKITGLISAVKKVAPQNPYIKVKKDVLKELYEKVATNIPEKVWICFLLHWFYGYESHLLSDTLTMFHSVTNLDIPQQKILDSIKTYNDFQTWLEILTSVTSEKRNDREDGFTKMLQWVTGKLVTIQGFKELLTTMKVFSKDAVITVYRPPKKTSSKDHLNTFDRISEKSNKKK